MIRITGKPAAKVGPSSRDCSGDDLSVPGPCVECRQVARWLPRTLSWVQKETSRFKSIVKAILQEHDDILKSLCGFCMVQPVQTCECFASSYKLIGLPSTIEVASAPDLCLTIYDVVNIDVACMVICETDCPEGDECVKIFAPDPAIPKQWAVVCGVLCEGCERVALDPCNNPEHLEVMSLAYAAAVASFNARGTGPAIIAALSILFPGSAPQIVAHELGLVTVYLGRAMTPAERRYLPFFKSLLPTGFGVEVRFVSPVIDGVINAV